MRAAAMVLSLVACPVQHASDGAGPPNGGAGGAPSPRTSTHESTTAAEPSTSEGGSSGAASWTIEESGTKAWIVVQGSCVPLSFRPKDALCGDLLVRGVSIPYTREADELELGPSAWRHQGGGVVSRRCRTRLRIGPGRTLGGATLFDDEAACVAGRADAAPLDESAEATAARCRGEPVAVITDEVECGLDGRYAILAGRPGCIGVAASGVGQ